MGYACFCNPYVWKRDFSFDDFEEIKGLKKRIDLSKIIMLQAR